jgi:hypothetical protein
LAIAWWGIWSHPALAQRPAVLPHNAADRAQPAGELIAMSFDIGGGRQQITLVDPRTHMMSVYHVDPASGELSLKSVRNVHWDLQMDEFNGTNPSPREIRSLLGNRPSP